MAGNIKPLFDGLKAATSTGTVTMDGNLFGGFDLNADGTNAAVLEVREDTSTGRLLVHSKSTTGKISHAPYKSRSKTLYYSISGTGADMMLYEWVE